MGLRDLPRRVDLPVQDDERPHPDGLGRYGDTYRIRQVSRTVTVRLGCGPLGSDENRWLLVVDREVEEECRLLERIGAMCDDDPSDLGP